MFEKIYKDMIKSLKNKDKIKEYTIKLVMDKSRDMARKKHLKEPTDSMVIFAIKKEILQTKETIDMIELATTKEKAKEIPLYKKCLKIIDILENYLKLK